MSAQPSPDPIPTIRELQRRLISDAVILLQQASLIRGGMLANERICKLLGLTPIDLGDAAQRVARRQGGPLIGDVVPIRPVQQGHPRPEVVWDKKGNRKNPKPGLRRCGHCEEIKPLSEFRVKGRTKTGEPQYKSFCLPCEAAYQRGRYLTVKMLDQLGKVHIGFTADQDLACSVCGEPIVAGEAIVVHGQSMHAHHASEEERQA